MTIAIRAENLSKAYQIGQIGTGTVSRDIERWFVTKVMRREDPFLKIGEVNDRSKKGESDIVWSLKDINFDIKQGDAVGIIGKNGAGKSTLLKLLSRVTSPTTGSVKLKGRVASLLEVGTGFHPELTGRENIYLNGAILGMRKREIDRKFDEIVDFSGVERYIDTPVKRYSSGMYVRLAFAVAAHLESEILIVDEVLAVGDAEFQKKCLGKMQDVSKGEGRTILFVSHNMASIATLCNKGILLSNGQFKAGVLNANDAISIYSKEDFGDVTFFEREKFGVRLSCLKFSPEVKFVRTGESLELSFDIENNGEEEQRVLFNIELKSEFNEPIYCIGNEFNNGVIFIERHLRRSVRIKIHEVDLRPGTYKAFLWVQLDESKTVVSEFIPTWTFNVGTSNYVGEGALMPNRPSHGYVVKKYRKSALDENGKDYIYEI